MMKRLIYLLTLSACLLCGVDLSARQLSGQWTALPVTGDFSNVIETGDRTYFLCGPSLFSLSDDGEFYAYNTTNKLTDNSITGIWYNTVSRYLAIAYTNGNIDLLHDDGSVVNMAEIKEAVITGSHRINDISFGNGRIYIATDFGIVVYDENKHTVIESGIYNQPVTNVMSLDDHIAIFTEYGCFTAPADIRHNTLDKFTRAGTAWAARLVPVGKNSYVFIHTDGPVYLGTISDDAQSVQTHKLDTGDLPGTSVGRSSDGAFFTYGDKICFISAKDGSLTTAAFPEGYGIPAFAASGIESVWTTGNDGLANFRLSGNKPTLLSQGFMPEGISTDKPVDMHWTSDGSRLYIGNVNTSLIVSGAIGDGYNDIARTSYIENGSILNAQPREIAVDHEAFTRFQKNNNTAAMIGGVSRFCVDPDDNSIIYVPTRIGGLFVLKDGKVLNLINSTNSPTAKTTWNDGTVIEEIIFADIDQDGNLWILEEGGDGQSFKVLSSAKRKAKIDKVTAADWTSFGFTSDITKPFRDMRVTFCKKSNINFIFHGNGSGLLAMDNNGTPSNFRDDKFTLHKSITDRSGSEINIDHITCATEDADGKVWIGTTIGLFVIDNPAEAMNQAFTVRRPIVPRNDGTQLGDYLLSTEKIYDIAVDPTNRKWIATESSGTYLVSADGTKILQNFTTDNSPLPENCVYSVACDMSSNKVYIGASGGTLVYNSDASPAADSYSDVYAYPNPVRPEYTGWITVTGLMDGSLVKIADAAGNVFYQGTSEGGMVTWDGCDSTGNRVRSGIYFVFASQNGQGSSGAVTKIMVIN